MRTILFFILFICSLNVSAFAETLYVGDKKEYNLLSHASLYDDISNKMSLEEVRKETWTSIGVDELAFPVSKDAHWLRYRVENNTETTKSYYLEYDVSTINFLDLYVLKDGAVQQQYLTGAHRPLANRALVYHSYIFPLTLEAGEQKEIYVRMKHLFSAIPANMILKEQTAFLFDNYNTNVLEGVFFGIMLVMFFYNLVLYLMTRYKPYIAYIAYIGTFGTWLSLRMGYGHHLFDFMSVEVYRYFEISISILFTVFIIWFITGVFDLKRVMSRAYRVLNIISSLFIISWASICILMFLGIEGYYQYPSTLFFINFMLMNLSIVVIVSILAWRGNRTAVYILLAWMLFISSMVILTLSLTNIIPPYGWIMPYMQVTMIVETVMLSLILGDRYRQKEQQLGQQSRLASMGSMMENIAHQWRQPLSEINADLLALEMHIEDDDTVNIKKRIEIIENKTAMMSHTIDDFQNFYNKDKSKKKFELNQLLERAVHFSEDRLSKYSIEYTTNEKKILSVYGVENEYFQVVMAILNNAIDALKTKKENRTIKVTLTHEDSFVVVRIKNNGSQIEPKNLFRLFEPYFSTKDSPGTHGIGLFMSHKIIEEGFEGTLEISNIDEGVEVTIKVKNA